MSTGGRTSSLTIAPTTVSIALLCFLNSMMAFAGESTKSIVAMRTLNAPHIDGQLNEPEWQRAVPVASFSQFDPHEREPATEETSVRILYDDQAIYVGVMCYDTQPQRIIRQMSRRDRTAEADKFTIIVDSYHDHLTAFVFSGTVSGVQTDGVLSQGGRTYDTEWDAVWHYATRIVRNGWSAEFAIPFSALRFNRDDEMVWGINFRRYIARKGETVEWVMIPRSESGSVAKMGHLSGLRGVQPPQRLELMPYAVSKAHFAPQPAPFPASRDLTANGGFDAKVGLSNEFTLDASINPDFGQVEVDRAVINLTVFETLYPEKRPFFLEGKQIFTFGETYDRSSLQLFYSRRIGQQPRLSVALPSGYTFSENPDATTILGAAKLTGRTSGGLTIGALATITDREFVSLQDLSGTRTSPTRIEPRASYNVLRLRQDVLENSAVGVMATSSYKEDFGPAYSEGIDWNLRFSRSAYVVEGYAAGSQYVNSMGNQVHGSAGKVYMGKVAGERWLAVTSYDYASPRFWINDLGFFNRPREHGGLTQILFKDDRLGASFLRRYVLSFQTDYRWNYNGAKTLSTFEFQPSLEFPNFWYLTLTYLHDFPAFDDENRGIIGLYRRPRGDTYRLSLITDPRQKIHFESEGAFNTTAKGGLTWLGSLSAVWRPFPSIELTPGLRIIRGRKDEAWVYTPGGTVIGNIYDPAVSSTPFSFFGDRDYDELDVSLRGIFAFTPKVTFQFFGQVLLDGGTFRNFQRLVGPTTLVPYDFENSPQYVSPDFNEKTINANFVFRWEYLPGSTLYLIWTHYRYGDTGVFGSNVRQNLSDAFRLPADNAFLVKATYWWSL